VAGGWPGCHALEALVRQAAAARDLVDRRRPERILTVGGDCGVEIVPLSYLNARYRGRIGVLWFDAHADANNPSTSPSGNFHGMPVRTLLGDGPAPLRALGYSVLRPEQVFLVGVRSLDPGERAFVAARELVRCPARGVGFEVLPAMLAARGFEYLYLHVDFDVLDPDEFPSVWYPTPGGVAAAELIRILRRLRERFTVVGGSVLECMPAGAGDAALIDEVLFEGFGLEDSSSPHRRSIVDAKS
jgi:arginase